MTYIDPEETDEYWIGVWDFMRDILRKGRGKDWIFDSRYFSDCLSKIPDMMIDDLRYEYDREDLAVKAEEILDNKLGGV